MRGVLVLVIVGGRGGGEADDFGGDTFAVGGAEVGLDDEVVRLGFGLVDGSGGRGC